MALTSQIRIVHALADFLLAEESKPFPVHSEPKPSFIASSTPPKLLPRTTPEAVGVPSKQIEWFLREIAAQPDTCVHSLLMARNGQVFAEGHFAPFRPDIWHVTHSLAKSFLGTAVGMAIEEGLFGIDDEVAPYFSDKIGRFAAKQIKNVTVRYLLTMSSGIAFNEISQTIEEDWLHGMFASQMNFAPGSKFQYNSLNSFMLSALIQRTSGMRTSEYLQPRLFEPLGFAPVAWERSPDGIDKGGWGMYCTVEDLLKLGQLYLNNGSWLVDGKVKQILPQTWVQQATTTQITSDIGEQYGYHIWVDGNSGAYLMNGMFGQNITVIPRSNIVIAMTSGSPYIAKAATVNQLMQKWWYGFDAPLQPLPQNPFDAGRLRKTLQSLRFMQPAPQPARVPLRIPARTRQQRWNNLRKEISLGISPDVQFFCGTTWQFKKNRAGILPVVLQVMNNNITTGVQGVHLQLFDNGELLMLWEEGEATLCLPIGPANRPAEYFMRIGPETFLVANSWALAYDEDNLPVLKIQIALLEHSSSRMLKLKLRDGQLILEMDECPALLTAIGATLKHGKNAVGGNDSLGATLLNIDSLDRRIRNLCTPVLEGTPVASSSNTAADIEPAATALAQPTPPGGTASPAL